MSVIFFPTFIRNIVNRCPVVKRVLSRCYDLIFQMCISFIASASDSLALIQRNKYSGYPILHIFMKNRDIAYNMGFPVALASMITQPKDSNLEYKTSAALQLNMFSQISCEHIPLNSTAFSI